MAEPKFPISEDLQKTVKKDARIKEVYFGEDGSHYFTKHTIEVHKPDDKGYSESVKKVEALPGTKRQLLKVKVPGNRVTFKDKMVNVDYKPIALTMSRDEVLAAKTIAKVRTTAEKMAILADAKQILAEGDVQELLEKLTEKTAESAEPAKPETV